MKMIKRMFAMLLAMVLVAGMVPVSAHAEETTSTPFKVEFVRIDCTCEEGHDIDEFKTFIVEAKEQKGPGKVYWGFTIQSIHGYGSYVGNLEYTLTDYDCGKALAEELTYTKTLEGNTYTLYVKATREAQAHDYKAATCLAPEICKYCGVTRGEKDPNNHANEKISYTKISETHHEERRSCCKELIATSEHEQAYSATCYRRARCGDCEESYGNMLSHSCTYTVDGETITQKCIASGCNHEKTAALQLKTDADLTYTGQAIEPCEMVYPEGWVSTNMSTPITYEQNINVGKAKAKITFRGYLIEKEFDIAARSLDDEAVTVSMTPTGGTYTGKKHEEPEYTLSLNGTPLVEGIDYTADTWEGDFTNAGDNTITLMGMGNFEGTKTLTYTIGKAYPTVTPPTAKTDLVYNGQPQSLIKVGSTTVGRMEYNVSEDGNGIYSNIALVKMDAGTYKVWYKAVVDADNTNYTTTEPAFVEVTIAKAEPTVAAPTAITGLVYNGQEQELVEASTTGGTEGTFTYEMNGQNAQPIGKDAGEYEVTWIFTPTDTDNYKVVTGTEPISVTIGKADPGSFPTPDNHQDLTYNGEAQALAVVSATNYYPGHFEFALSENDKIAPASGWSQEIPTAADAGDYIVWWKFVGDKNHKDLTPAVYTKTIAPKSIETGEADIEAPSLTWDGSEQTAALSKFTLDGLEVTYDLSGNTAVNVGLHDMTITGKDNFTGERKFSFLIVPDEDILKGLETSNVTPSRQETIDKAKEMAENADTENLPEEMKQALKDIDSKADTLQERIEDAEAAANTEDITKTKDITADNATVGDKKTLTDAKADLEDALSTYGTNYTAGERKIITDEIDRIEDILADIAKAEEATKLVEELPKTVESDDGKDWDAVKKAQDAYDALDADQKKIVDNSTDGKLAKHQATLRAIKVEKISATKWYKGSNKDLTITYDGPYSKFSHLEVNGKTLDTKHYTVKDGSTVITLKASYLETLTSRNSYNVVAVYDIGDEEIKSEKATFSVYKDVASAATGDQFNVGLWAGIGGVSIIALIALLVIMKKKMK